MTPRGQTRDMSLRVPGFALPAYAFFPMRAGQSGASLAAISEGRSIMPVWAWVLAIAGTIGFLGAVLIVAALFEFTWMPFRRWDALP